MTESQDNSHDDLGVMVAIWQVSELRGGAKVFDLIDADAEATGRVIGGEALVEALEFDAGPLPVGSYLILAFPKAAMPPEVTDETQTGPEGLHPHG